MTYKHLVIDKKDRVAVVTLNRPERSNALSVDLMGEIIRAAEAFHNDTDTRVIVFTGRGKNFSVGVDLKDPKMIESGSASLLETQRNLAVGPKMIRRIFDLNQITIAAVNGKALGGGACMATACDFRIGASDCEIGYPECGLGMNLSWTALPLCVHLIGPAKAKQMVILARREPAITLQAWGFLDNVVPPERLMDAALKTAGAYAEQAPAAAQMIKRSVNHIVSALDRAIMHMDTDQFILTTRSRDFQEGIDAWLAKRKPEFSGD